MGRTQHEQCRFARHCRPAGVEEHITRERIAFGSWEVLCLAKEDLFCTGVRIGKRECVADDARAQEVGHRHSSCEAGEQSGAICSGAGGAKGGDQGELAISGPRIGLRAMQLETVLAHVSQQLITCGRARKHLTVRPEVGAVCEKDACPDLCGGREVTCVPTATAHAVNS